MQKFAHEASLGCLLFKRVTNTLVPNILSICWNYIPFSSSLYAKIISSQLEEPAIVFLRVLLAEKVSFLNENGMPRKSS